MTRPIWGFSEPCGILAVVLNAVANKCLLPHCIFMCFTINTAYCKPYYQTFLCIIIYMYMLYIIYMFISLSLSLSFPLQGYSDRVSSLISCMRTRPESNAPNKTHAQMTHFITSYDTAAVLSLSIYIY